MWQSLWMGTADGRNDGDCRGWPVIWRGLTAFVLLYTAGIPDTDLVIRTGGELRISNFLLWQAAYAEYYFTKVLWPNFTPKQVERALTAFGKRKRRFGGL